MLTLHPITIGDACVLVKRHHRHHKPPQGALFAIGAAAGDSEEPCAAVIVGRPVARMNDDGWTCEVVRLVSDGSRNACSLLYRAAWRAAKAMGYRRLITYTLPEEGGASLRGAGFKLLGERGGGSWSRTARPRVDKAPLQKKLAWEITLLILFVFASSAEALTLSVLDQTTNLIGQPHFGEPVISGNVADFPRTQYFGPSISATFTTTLGGGGLSAEVSPPGLYRVSASGFGSGPPSIANTASLAASGITSEMASVSNVYRPDYHNLPASWGLSVDVVAAHSLDVITALSVTAGFRPGIINVRGLSFELLLAGDYNGDATVNAADYPVWRNGLGTVFEFADYEVWRGNYGATYVEAAGAVIVPDGLVAWVGCGVLFGFILRGSFRR